MPRTGRPPLPQKVRELHGERRPSRTRAEPQPLERRPEPPDFLAPEALKVWRRIVPEIEAMGLLYAADANELAAFASSVALFAESERQLRSEGYMRVDEDGNVRRSPWLLVRRDALNELHRLGSAFGLTPAARAHLATKPEPKDQPDEALLSAA